MSTYRKEWPCCGSVTETESWEPESCPFCTTIADAIEEREKCATVARNAAAEAERIGKLHPEGSESRSRMFARAREANAIAVEIMVRSNAADQARP